MPKGIIGTKAGMTQVFGEEGKAIPVTVIEAGPCIVVQKKTIDKDGYNAIQLGFGEGRERLINKPLRGHFARIQKNVEGRVLKPLRFLKEVRVEEEDIDLYRLGQELRIDIFAPGERVDITGISKGKGFAGGIKRHGFHRGPMSHGSKYHRRPGSLGAKGPARVFKGRKLPGHKGVEKVTVQNLEVVKVDPARNLLAVKGAVPGLRGSLLLIKSSIKSRS